MPHERSFERPASLSVDEITRHTCLALEIERYGKESGEAGDHQESNPGHLAA